ncbi:hypothetical protein E0Z10_g3136 [Xylaria hypoxylon]|uniref:Small ribosomal subunit protein uS10m n=1 Tax=Xylaria hypoxylon TaxID=37992 RepID=A0A4Z0Z073_9PEZI|nr:hypothetical protein E0Z10_g3136 [Xylaria hypoxylon]
MVSSLEECEQRSQHHVEDKSHKANTAGLVTADCRTTSTCSPSVNEHAFTSFSNQTESRTTSVDLPDPAEENDVRLPRSVQALYLQPLRRETEYGVPSCDLQLRSFSIPNLEFFCDFALRAAYYLNLPAFGPVPLPKIIERWTVPRSHFIFKKSQENFERITRRRLIQIRDGHPETVQIWLAFLQKHAYYGIGMKANMWEYSPLDTSKQMDSELPSMQKSIDEKMELLGQSKALGTVEKVKELLESERFKHTA